nr:hypothetical protein [Tanacetum cinerariifolium]
MSEPNRLTDSKSGKEPSRHAKDYFRLGNDRHIHRWILFGHSKMFVLTEKLLLSRNEELCVPFERFGQWLEMSIYQRTIILQLTRIPPETI